jgi:hypothetical protein
MFNHSGPILETVKVHKLNFRILLWIERADNSNCVHSISVFLDQYIIESMTQEAVAKRFQYTRGSNKLEVYFYISLEGASS